MWRRGVEGGGTRQDWGALAVALPAPLWTPDGRERCIPSARMPRRPVGDVARGGKATRVRAWEASRQRARVGRARRSRARALHHVGHAPPTPQAGRMIYGLGWLGRGCGKLSARKRRWGVLGGAPGLELQPHHPARRATQPARPEPASQDAAVEIQLLSVGVSWARDAEAAGGQAGQDRVALARHPSRAPRTPHAPPRSPLRRTRRVPRDQRPGSAVVMGDGSGGGGG